MDQDSKAVPQPRQGQGDVSLSREVFGRRLSARFYDPLFDAVRPQIERIIDVAWASYQKSNKSPRTRKAGSEFKDPDYELSVEWLDTRSRIQQAEQRYRDQAAPARILLICGAARHDQTCPGEMSKSFRLTQIARQQIEAAAGVKCDLLDLSMLTAQYGRQILPCKVCVSTDNAAVPLALLVLPEPRDGASQ